MMYQIGLFAGGVVFGVAVTLVFINHLIRTTPDEAQQRAQRD